MKAFLVVGVVALLFSLSTTYAYQVCGNVYVWRNNNMTCPDLDAVCADVFDTTRDWMNGTRCEEHRVLHNCMCPGNQICPTSNNNNRFYESRSHSRYTCQDKCETPWCANVRSRDIYPMTTIRRAPEFGGRTYNQIDCRCPRHHTPVTGRRGMARSVRTYSHGWDYERHSPIVRYVCSGRRSSAGDPCA